MQIKETVEEKVNTVKISKFTTDDGREFATRRDAERHADKVAARQILDEMYVSSLELPFADDLVSVYEIKNDGDAAGLIAALSVGRHANNVVSLGDKLITNGGDIPAGEYVVSTLYEYNNDFADEFFIDFIEKSKFIDELKKALEILA